MRSDKRGFSILELLIAVGIIGLLAAMVIANYFNAQNRAKQKRTMADMRGVALAWEARGADAKSYNAAGFTMPAAPITYVELVSLLSPTYMRNIPRFDGWGKDFDLAADQPVGGRAASEYAIRSAGRDGVFAGPSYTSGATTNLDCDIVYSGGQFIIWPEGTQH
jgi:type II secretion system protein G